MQIIIILPLIANKKYWKVPIVYGGFIGLGYIVHYYNEQHSIFKSELFSILNDADYVSPYNISEQQVRTIIEKARRERDYMIIMTGAFYFLQIVDAHIDAHLRDFDLNPNLQVKLKPSLQPMLNSGVIGFGITFKF